METITLDNDMNVFYITASSFPNGVKQAHERLHAKVPFSTQRKYFGISRPENNVITYKAAAEELHPGEAKKYNCQAMVIKKGTYIAETVYDFMQDIESIGRTFQKLLQHPGIDPQGYCVEQYLNDKDVLCMVRLV